MRQQKMSKIWTWSWPRMATPSRQCYLLVSDPDHPLVSELIAHLSTPVELKVVEVGKPEQQHAVMSHSPQQHRLAAHALDCQVIVWCRSTLKRPQGA